MHSLIGLVGVARSGKDTVAGLLGELIGAQRVAFADPLRKFTRDVFDFTDDQVNGNAKEVPDPRWDGLTPRRAMQALGTEFGRAMHPDVWIRYALRKAAMLRELAPVVISDVRFENEAQAIRDAGGLVWRVIRPGLLRPESTHASELEQAKIRVDLEISNKGSVDDLRSAVRGLFG